MRDSTCKIYLYYELNEEKSDLYGWSTKKEISKMFEDSRNMSRFEKKERTVYTHELEDLFYEYGDRFIDARKLSYGEDKVKVAMTKTEWLNVENTVNTSFIYMQKAAMDLNLDIFTDKCKNQLSTIGLDKCIYSLSMNSPAIQSIFTAQEFMVFISMYDQYLCEGFVDNIEYVKKGEK